MMDNLRTMLPAAVFVVAFVVLIGGHELGHPSLVYLVPGWAPMQPLTALTLIAASLVVVLARRSEEGILSFSALSGLVAYMAGLGIAGWSGISGALGFGTGDLATGPPSIGTLAAFGLVELIGLRALFGRRSQRIGWALVLIGMVALLGYVVEAPPLYYEGVWGPGMAVHTALCVIALGVASTGPTPDPERRRRPME